MIKITRPPLILILAAIVSLSVTPLPCFAADTFPANKIKLVENKEVTLRGVINLMTVPVPDDLVLKPTLSESTQTGYFLITPYSLSAEGRNPESEQEIIRFEGQMLFHLALTKELETKIEKLKGKPVEIVATPFVAHTRYHRTPFLLDVKSIRALAK